MKAKDIAKLEWILSICDACGIAVILIVAFGIQILAHELPCPLCLLQRLGFLAMSFGFLMNLRYGIRPIHYSMVQISSILTGIIALRQIALHLTAPHGSGYGMAIFGLHMYTWVLIICLICLLYTSINLGIERQYLAKPQFGSKRKTHIWVAAAFWIVIFIAAGNAISSYLECGFTTCPDNPAQYEKLAPKTRS